MLPYDQLGLKRFSGLVSLSALVGLLPLACVYDDGQRCGPHQRIISNDRCACEEGFVASDAGCVPCAENEKATNGECICVDGFARPADGAACEPIPQELGAACDAEGGACSDKFPLCHVADSGSSYCTNSCKTDADCTGGFKCHEDDAGNYCRRQALGYGDSCESDADCAGKEASYCETLSRNICLVPCSAGHTDGCFEGESCCDFVVFAPICVPSAACTDNGGKVVP